MLTADEQALFDFAIGALPSWIRTEDEILMAFAKIFGAAFAQSRYLMSQTLITQATGVEVVAGVPVAPDWLNQHARDRDTSRQPNELDGSLSSRLRVVPDALTRQALLDAANAILQGNGISGSAALLELPRDGAYIGRYIPIDQTSSGTFAKDPDGTTMRFTPFGSVWFGMPWIPPNVFPGYQFQVVLGGCIEPGNDGTFAITRLDGDAIVYTNPAGVSGPDGSGPDIEIFRLDSLGNVTDGNTFFRRAFIGRGWRMTTTRPFGFLLILPYGTTAGIQASVQESLRLKKAAGYKVLVERRQNP